MELGVQVLALAVLATAEFCAEPIDGGVGEPQFCRITSNQEVSTPFFSIVVESGFLVGIHHNGRKLQIQSSIRQSMDVLTVERVEGAQLPIWSDCPTLAKTIEDNVTWHDCRYSANGTYHRRLLAELKGSFVVIDYSYAQQGALSSPALERMTQSIHVHAI
jgi:hypothetical protein